MIPTLNAIFGEHRHQAGALLPILHDIQHALGYVPDEAVPLIAKELNLSRAEVHGVITYYHHFRRTPLPKHVVHVCCAERARRTAAKRWQNMLQPVCSTAISQWNRCIAWACVPSAPPSRSTKQRCMRA